MNKPLLFAIGLAAALPAAQQQPVFRGRVDLVAVDVHVVDRIRTAGDRPSARGLPNHR